MASMGVANPCAGPFGAIYDFYIERPWLTSLIDRVMWGAHVKPMYDAMSAISRVRGGATIVDAPCGGGVALRALRPEQDVRYVAVDIVPRMLERVRARAPARGLRQVETVEGDMRALPLPDASARLFCSFSGLHMIEDPERAVAEIARVLEPGGELVGSAFTADGTRRQRFLFARAARQGHSPPLATRAALAEMLGRAGLTDVEVGEGGFVVFRARRPVSG
jgi:ubiquinone/menaquinone biosynthesis C-methylase UbiE